MKPIHRFKAFIRVSAAVAIAVWLCGPSWAETVRDAIRDRFSQAGGKLDIDGYPLDAPLLEELYRKRNFDPIWRTGTHGAKRAVAVANRLARAWDEGLDPEAYAASAIFHRFAVAGDLAAAELDLLLTNGLVLFARDLRFGRVAMNGIGTRRSSGERRRYSAEGLIASALAAPDISSFLAGLGPDNPRYARLKAALLRYRAIAARGGWPAVPPGRALQIGAYDQRVPTLARRLRLSGDLPSRNGGASEGTESLFFGDELRLAVRRFQDRHGLSVDGVIGRRTLAELNMSVNHRIGQIAVNMERRRHLANLLGDRYVFVNIADATVKYVEQRGGIERTLIDMRAVVGLPYRETPVFSAEITQLQLNPSWYVPASIANKDLMPRVRRDPQYLTQHGFDILTRGGAGGRIVSPESIPKQAFDAVPFPYLIRQRPGPENALGRIKFVMPNPYDVYLHDTPARELLARTVRAFSSGCIRLEKPMELAALLRNTAREAIEDEIAKGKMIFIPLDKPVPVHLAYLTAWADKDGAVQFRDDIYGRDSRLAKQLSRR